MTIFPYVRAHTSAERWLFFRAGLAAVFLAVLDQVTKNAVLGHIRYGEKITVIPGFFDLTHVLNPGAAWGMLENRGLLLLTVSMTVLVFMILFCRSLCEGWTERYYAVFLIASGILGNSYDRIFRGEPGNFCGGKVVDFLRFYIGEYEWPSFNVADSCICVGVCTFILSSFLRPDKKTVKNAEKNASHEPEKAG